MWSKFQNLSSHVFNANVSSSKQPIGRKQRPKQNFHSIEKLWSRRSRIRNFDRNRIPVLKLPVARCRPSWANRTRVRTRKIFMWYKSIAVLNCFYKRCYSGLFLIQHPVPVLLTEWRSSCRGGDSNPGPLGRPQKCDCFTDTSDLLEGQPKVKVLHLSVGD